MISRFSVLVGAVYYLTWPHPLVMTLLNCLYYLGVGFLARGLAPGLTRRLGQPPARAAGLALVICLWPASLAWSALPMKDSPSLFLALAILSLLLYLAQGAATGRGLRAGQGRVATLGRWLLAATGLGLCAALMIYMRFYFGYVILGACALPLLARLLPGSPPRPSWPALLGVLALGMAIFLGTRPWHQEYFVFFQNGEALPRSQFEAKSRKADIYEYMATQAAPPAVPAPAEPGGAAPTSPAASRPDVPKTSQGLDDLWRELNAYRQRFLHFAGRSLAPDADASLSGGLIAALRDCFFFPYPWER